MTSGSISSRINQMAENRVRHGKAFWRNVSKRWRSAIMRPFLLKRNNLTLDSICNLFHLGSYAFSLPSYETRIRILSCFNKFFGPERQENCFILKRVLCQLVNAGKGPHLLSFPPSQIREWSIRWGLSDNGKSLFRMLRVLILPISASHLVTTHFLHAFSFGKMATNWLERGYFQRKNLTNCASNFINHWRKVI